jgi:hypothetical protein
MPLRGQVYFSGKTVLPPGQMTPHRFVIVSHSAILATSGNRVFANVALIRSAKRADGSPVRLMPGHSIPVTPKEVSSLQHDSIIETHQLFAVPLDLFQGSGARIGLAPIDTLPGPLLSRVLEGCRRLFT